VTVLIREGWHVGDEGKHRDDEGGSFSRTWSDVSA
jgi:hypothetical protein